jgi:O-antigen/teichoic acid export membrane protein
VSATRDATAIGIAVDAPTDVEEPTSNQRTLAFAVDAPTDVEEPTSTQRALAFVYAGYTFRYAYLLVLIPFYGRVLGAEEYGRLLAAMSLYTLVWVLGEYGFPIAGARDTAATTDRSRLASIFGQHLAGRLLLVPACLLLGLGGTLLSPLLREHPMMGALATLNGVVAAFNIGWYFQGTLRFRTSVAIEVAGFAINLPAILWLVRGPGDAHLVLAVLLGSALLCTGIAYGIALGTLNRRALRLHGAITLVRECTALFAHKGISMMLASSSTYVLSLFASAAQVGWYGAAERLASVGLSLMQPANHVLIGTVAKRIADQRSEASAYRLMRNSYLVMVGFGLVLMAGTWLLAEPLVPLILGPSFGATVGILYALAFMFPFAAFGQVTSGYVMVPLRMDKTMSLVSLAGAACTVSLMLAWAAVHAGYGIALARIAGSILSVLMLIWVLHRKRLLQRIWNA